MKLMMMFGLIVMMARIKVSRNFRVGDLVKYALPTTSDMRAAGEQLAVKIENRTLSGKDEDGRKFAPCADSTGKSGPVTFHDTSRMFADFGVIKATRHTGRWVSE